jgi:branched-chain amino acid transport system permease protein
MTGTRRAHAGPSSGPGLKTWLLPLSLLLAAFAFEFGLERVIADSSLRQLLAVACINVMIALSLNIINGLAGQFSIGHAGFVAVGAYSGAVVVSHLEARGLSPSFGSSLVAVPLALLVGGALAGAFGFLVGLPSLRLRGDYLAIVTLGFAEIVRLSISSASKILENEPLSLKGGVMHAVSVAVAKLGGSNGYQGTAGAGVPAFAGPFWLVLVLGLSIALALRIKHSGWGRALRALREDEIASASLGVDPTRYKVRSFVLAAIGAGMAGALSSTLRDGTPIVQPETYSREASFDAITMVILGGSGSVSGSILGALMITLSVKAIEFLQGTDLVKGWVTSLPWLDLNALRMILYAAVLIAVMLWRPEGILGEREFKWFRENKDEGDSGGPGKEGKSDGSKSSVDASTTAANQVGSQA